MPVLGSASAGAIPTTTSATIPAAGPCAAGTAPAVVGHRVGITDCLITAVSATSDVHGHRWSEAAVALSGTAAGFVPTSGAPRADMTDRADQIYPQFGIDGWKAGITTYSGASPGAGNGLTVLWPDNRADWNGRVMILVPGQSNVPPIGALVGGAGAAPDSMAFSNLYADPLLNRGWALIYVRRQAANGLTATLDGGGTAAASLNDSVSTFVDWVDTGEALLRQALGAAADTVEVLGHSSGNLLANLLRESGLNTVPGGRHVVDGVLAEDQAGGLPAAVDIAAPGVIAVHDGRVTYPRGAALTGAEQAQLVPELTNEHDLYLDTHTWLPAANYLALKRATDLASHGPNRFYEVRGVSHLPDQVGSAPGTLDITGLVLAEVDDLTAWVERGVAPPASVTDVHASGAQPAQGKALDLPPIACPTAVQYPAQFGAQTTQSAALSAGPSTGVDGSTLEPLDTGGALVDVNRDGVRDALPTISAYWRGLPAGSAARQALAQQHTGTVTTAVFVRCVGIAVHLLEGQRLLAKANGDAYLAAAAQFPSLRW